MASPIPSESAAIAIGADRLGRIDAHAFSANPPPSLPEGRQRLPGVCVASLRTRQ